MIKLSVARRCRHQVCRMFCGEMLVLMLLCNVVQKIRHPVAPPSFGISAGKHARERREKDLSTRQGIPVEARCGPYSNAATTSSKHACCSRQRCRILARVHNPSPRMHAAQRLSRRYNTAQRSTPGCIPAASAAVTTAAPPLQRVHIHTPSNQELLRVASNGLKRVG